MNFDTASLNLVAWDAKYPNPKVRGRGYFTRSKLTCYFFLDDASMDTYKRKNKYSAYWYTVGVANKTPCRIKVL